MDIQDYPIIILENDLEYIFSHWSLLDILWLVDIYRAMLNKELSLMSYYRKKNFTRGLRSEKKMFCIEYQEALLELPGTSESSIDHNMWIWIHTYFINFITGIGNEQHQGSVYSAHYTAIRLALLHNVFFRICPLIFGSDVVIITSSK